MSAFPPIQLRDIGDAALQKPVFVAEGREEMRIGELLVQPLDSRVAEMVVVVVADDDCVDDGQVFDFARRRRVPLEVLEIDGRTAVFEDGVEQGAEPVGKLNVVACMPEPCSP